MRGGARRSPLVSQEPVVDVLARIDLPVDLVADIRFSRESQVPVPSLQSPDDSHRFFERDDDVQPPVEGPHRHVEQPVDVLVDETEVARESADRSNRREYLGIPSSDVPGTGTAQARPGQIDPVSIDPVPGGRFLVEGLEPFIGRPSEVLRTLWGEHDERELPPPVYLIRDPG